MIAGLPARLRVIRRTLTKLPLLAKTERAAITKGHQGELPSLTGLLCMEVPIHPKWIIAQSSTLQITFVRVQFCNKPIEDCNRTHF